MWWDKTSEAGQVRRGPCAFEPLLVPHLPPPDLARSITIPTQVFKSRVSEVGLRVCSETKCRNISYSIMTDGTSSKRLQPTCLGLHGTFGRCSSWTSRGALPIWFFYPKPGHRLHPAAYNCLGRPVDKLMLDKLIRVESGMSCRNNWKLGKSMIALTSSNLCTLFTSAQTVQR